MPTAIVAVCTALIPTITGAIRCDTLTAVFVGSETLADLVTYQNVIEKFVLRLYSQKEILYSDAVVPWLSMPFDNRTTAVSDKHRVVLLSTCFTLLLAPDSGVEDDHFERWLVYVRNVFLQNSEGQLYMTVSSAARQATALEKFRQHHGVEIRVEKEDPTSKAHEKGLKERGDSDVVVLKPRPLRNGVFSTRVLHRPTQALICDRRSDLPSKTAEHCGNNRDKACIAQGRAVCGTAIDFIHLVSRMANATFKLV